jgi:hypothetical protein
MSFSIFFQKIKKRIKFEQKKVYSIVYRWYGEQRSVFSLLFLFFGGVLGIEEMC